MKWEVVTIGRRRGYPDRNNVRYRIVNKKPRLEVGDSYWDGDYEIEVIYIKNLGKNYVKIYGVPKIQVPGFQKGGLNRLGTSINLTPFKPIFKKRIYYGVE